MKQTGQIQQTGPVRQAGLQFFDPQVDLYHCFDIFTKDVGTIDFHKITLRVMNPNGFRYHMAMGIEIMHLDERPSANYRVKFFPIQESLRIIHDIQRILGLRCETYVKDGQYDAPSIFLCLVDGAPANTTRIRPSSSPGTATLLYLECRDLRTVMKTLPILYAVVDKTMQVVKFDRLFIDIVPAEDTERESGSMFQLCL